MISCFRVVNLCICLFIIFKLLQEMFKNFRCFSISFRLRRVRRQWDRFKILIFRGMFLGKMLLRNWILVYIIVLLKRFLYLGQFMVLQVQFFGYVFFDFQLEFVVFVVSFRMEIMCENKKFMIRKLKNLIDRFVVVFSMSLF